MLVKLSDLDDEASLIPFGKVWTSLVLDANMTRVSLCSVNLFAAFMCLIRKACYLLARVSSPGWMWFVHVAARQCGYEVTQIRSVLVRGVLSMTRCRESV